MIAERLHGTGTALVTPFDKKLQVDFKGLAKLLQFINEGGINYWVIHGTTGEAATTTWEEKQAILGFVKAHNPRNLPIVCGLGGNNTQELLKSLANIDLQAIDAILTISPYYNKPSQKGIYLHYKALADVVAVPIILYNVPSRTGTNLEASTVLKLSEHPNIIGIKESSGNLEQCIEIAKYKPRDFLLISGDDILTIPMMAIGAVGVISTLANSFPWQISQMVEAGLKHDYIRAKQYQLDLLAMHQIIAQGGNPSATKQFLAARKICKNFVRLPLACVPNALNKQINVLLRHFNTA